MARPGSVLERVGSHIPQWTYNNPVTRAAVRRRLVLRPELRQRAKSLGEFFEFGATEELEFTEPYGVGPLPETVSRKLGIRTIPRPFVATLPDVQLVGPNAMPVLGDDSVIFENLLGSVNRAVVTHARCLTAGVSPTYRADRERVGPELAVSLVGPWDHEYHHWVSDYLTRLRGVEALIERIGEVPTVITPQNPHEWMTEFLDLLGVNPEDRIEWKGGRMHVDRFVVPSLPRETELTYPGAEYEGYVFSPNSYRYLRRKLSDAIADVPSKIPLSERVYVSRSDAPVRRIVNEETLLSELSTRGFESYILSEHSVADQIRLFQQASHVAGPMGAGLTNIAFSEDADVVTIFGDDLNACYFTQSQGLGHRFAYVRGEPVDGDIRVQVGDVLDAIDRTCD